MLRSTIEQAKFMTKYSDINIPHLQHVGGLDMRESPHLHPWRKTNHYLVPYRVQGVLGYFQLSSMSHVKLTTVKERRSRQSTIIIKASLEP